MKVSEIQYNLNFEKLCYALQLGEIVGMPAAISGGLLHRMYAIETTLGKYAIKALNPQIMHRPTAMQRYIHSEQIANIASRNIPALPAKRFNNTFMHEIDKQFYLVFDMIEGNSMKPSEITVVHCEKIGTILADIHMTDFSEIAVMNVCSDNTEQTDWNIYLQKGRESDAVWVNQLQHIVDKLYQWNIQASESARQLASDRVISHRDLDLKNVMWNNDAPIIIDWESAGSINPMQELVETAIYWSEDERGEMSKDRSLAFISGYRKRYGTLQKNWSIALLGGFSGKLGWLEYNLKRSLGIECTDEEEQQMGTAQVIATITALRSYADMIPILETWLNIED